jgi:hypothetical protein
MSVHTAENTPPAEQCKAESWWEFVQRIAREVEQWPAWKRGVAK